MDILQIILGLVIVGAMALCINDTKCKKWFADTRWIEWFFFFVGVFIFIGGVTG